jgi:hypothetical protein
MTKTIVALYDEFNVARDVVEDLVEAGFDRSNISIVANDVAGEYSRYTAEDMDTDDVKAGEGAGFGAVVGALVGLGTALIPGIGPVFAAGPAAAALMAGIGAATGAVTGGVAASLIDMGVSEEEAGYYLEGGTLVTVSTMSDTENDRARDIINHHNPVDVNSRGTYYRESGWSGYDANARPYTADQIREERNRYRRNY